MDLGDLFKALVWNNLIKAALARLFLAVPFLGWGPIGVVVSWVVTKIADKLYDELEMIVNLQAIALKNEIHQREFDRASMKLHIIAREKGTASSEFKNAREHAKESLSQFVRFAPAR